MDDQSPQRKDEYDYEVRSVYESLVKWFWIILCSLMWIGAITSMFTGSSALQSLASFAIAAGVSATFYFVQVRENGHF
jgi:hypothetical protein